MLPSQDILYLVLAVATVWVAGFLCWALYELARLLRQSNEVMAETREKLVRIEAMALSIREQLDSAFQYAGAIATGGKVLWSMFNRAKKRRKNDD